MVLALKSGRQGVGEAPLWCSQELLSITEEQPFNHLSVLEQILSEKLGNVLLLILCLLPAAGL